MQQNQRFNLFASTRSAMSKPGAYIINYAKLSASSLGRDNGILC